MGKGKGGGPPPEQNEPDSPTPDFTDVTDVGDVANAADYSIDISQAAADGNQADTPILLPVDDSISGMPNPAGGQPVDPNTGQPPADPTTGANVALGFRPVLRTPELTSQHPGLRSRRPTRTCPQVGQQGLRPRWPTRRTRSWPRLVSSPKIGRICSPQNWDPSFSGSLRLPWTLGG